MLNMSEISPPNSWCVSAVPVAGPSGLPKVGAVSGSLSYHRPGMPARAKYSIHNHQNTAALMSCGISNIKSHVIFVMLNE